MFRKRIRKEYPEGTFIPMPARVCAILQLCLGFSAFLWVVSEPFVGEIFTVKSHLLYYQDVMGIPASAGVAESQRERLARNSERFAALPESRQNHLQAERDVYQAMLQRSFIEKLGRVYTLFTNSLPIYELAWIILSIALSIMVLKKVEGAREAIWLLPLLVAAYAVDLRFKGTPPPVLGDERFFPSEKELVTDYMDEPLDADVFEQQKQLQLAWKKYLSINWANEQPAATSAALDRQAEEGEYRFTLARLEARSSRRAPEKLLAAPVAPPSPLILIVYFFWNAYIAYTVWKYSPETLENRPSL